MIYHFAITDPFNINWKYAVPKDFDTLEVFLKPGLSIELGGIANGPKKFAIGAFLTDGNNRNKFNNELLPGRSAERIAKAFQNEEVSAFFSAADAEELKKLFDTEQFTCRQVSVNCPEHGNDFFGLPTEEYGLVLDFFTETGVQQVADIKESRELFEGLREEAIKEVRDETRREQKSKMGGRSKSDSKKMKVTAAVGAGLLAVAGILKIGSKALAGKGFFAALASIGFNVLSASLSLTGIKLLSDSSELFAEGMYR